MVGILNRTSPAMELARKTLDVLLFSGVISHFEIKEKKDNKFKTIYFYFWIIFSDGDSCFELKVIENKTKEILYYNGLRNRMTLLIKENTEITPEVISKKISEVIDFMDKNKTNRGFIEENRLSKILEKLKTDGIIEDYRHSLKREDRDNGIDFIIIHCGKRIFIQGKSSRKYQLKHIEKFPHIPSIILKDRSDEKIEELVLLIIDKYYLSHTAVHV